MQIVFTEHFRRSYQSVSPLIKTLFEKQLLFLEKNLRHPSLHAKKYDERNDIWQARVNKDWRFYFIIRHDTITLLDIMVHPK